VDNLIKSNRLTLLALLVVLVSLLPADGPAIVRDWTKNPVITHRG
jgi:hypothetical protein